ncbi:MAG: PQQ-dependent sugar dehydrogenase [Rhodobacteraceae bacterium]|nr:PQQ-dependent sugar dehydrogenase [Paracoccaceae bacterium]
MSRLRILALALVAIVCLAGLFGGGIWAGYALNTEMQNRFSFPAQIHYKLNGMYNSYFNAGAEPEPERLVTNRAILSQETIFLPASAKDFAGGIGTIGEDTVLVTDRVGKMYSVTDAVVHELDVAPPDDHRAALQAQLDAGELGDIEINFNWMRFNDIFYYARGQEGAGYLLLSYTDWLPEQKCFGNAMARLPVQGMDPLSWSAEADDWIVIARTEPCLELFTTGKGMFGLEAGGRMDRMPDGRMAWSSGAYERADRFAERDFTNAIGQSDDMDYGKVMLINVESGEKTTIAKGLRNPQGVSVDAEGRIWVSDHGMQGGDELNLVFEGANFGFPAVSFGTKYNRQPAGNGDRHANHDGYDKPVIAFVPSIAPSSALAVENFHYAWDGDVLIGALSGAVHRVHVEDGRGIYVEPIDVEMRIRDMDAIHGGKTIVLYTDDRRLSFLTADTGPDPMARFDELLTTYAADADVLAAADGTMAACLQCHSLLDGVDNGAGPSLHNICSREPGNSPFEGYSGALDKLGGVWTEQTLQAYISDPYGMLPDTNMGWEGIENENVSLAISKALCEL